MKPKKEICKKCGKERLIDPIKHLCHECWQEEKDIERELEGEKPFGSVGSGRRI